MVRRRTHRPASRGQALVETALVLPIFLTIVLGVIVLGIGLFYQQQITNAAREAARYAAIHSATSTVPISSWHDARRRRTAGSVRSHVHVGRAIRQPLSGHECRSCARAGRIRLRRGRSPLRSVLDRLHRRTRPETSMLHPSPRPARAPSEHRARAMHDRRLRSTDRNFGPAMSAAAPPRWTTTRRATLPSRRSAPPTR